MVNTHSDSPIATATVQIAPNPLHHTLFFKTDMDGPFRWEILDASGQVCSKSSTPDFDQTLEVGFLKPGIYFLHLTNSENLHVISKFVKM
jgi:hypothetical protein